MWAPKLRTPGIARSSLLASVVMRTSSGCEVPGIGQPVHQEVALLELGEQRLPELREGSRRPITATTATVVYA